MPFIPKPKPEVKPTPVPGPKPKQPSEYKPTRNLSTLKRRPSTPNEPTRRPLPMQRTEYSYKQKEIPNIQRQDITKLDQGECNPSAIDKIEYFTKDLGQTKLERVDTIRMDSKIANEIKEISDDELLQQCEQ